MTDRKMRRFKQELPFEESERILRDGRYVVMAVAGDDDYPYSVPVNYVYTGKNIYLHSAMSGHKVDSLMRNPKCSLCIVDKDDVVPEEFTSYFRSVIVFGKADFVEDVNDKVSALQLLCAKYSPGINPDAEIAKLLKTVCVIRIDVERISGKEAIELTRKRNVEPKV